MEVTLTARESRFFMYSSFRSKSGRALAPMYAQAVPNSPQAITAFLTYARHVSHKDHEHEHGVLLSHPTRLKLEVMVAVHYA